MVDRIAGWKLLAALWAETVPLRDFVAAESAYREAEPEWPRMERELRNAFLKGLLGAFEQNDIPLLLRMQVLDQEMYRDAGSRAATERFLEVVVGGGKWLVGRRFVKARRTRTLQPFNRFNGLHYHHVIPAEVEGYDVQIRRSSTPVWDGCQRIADRAQPMIHWKIYIGSFPDGLQPDWDSEALTRGRWVASTMPAGRWEGVRAALEQAKAEGVDVLLLPELSVCPQLRGQVVAWLAAQTKPCFLLVLPGSFHEGGGQGRRPSNLAVLFAGRGKRQIVHRKLLPFGNAKGEEEEIDPGREIQLLNTPLGMLAIPICRDFLDDDGRVCALWQSLALDWLLVPSMNNGSINAHERAARAVYGQCGTGVAVANQTLDGVFGTGLPGESSLHGFVLPTTDQGESLEWAHFDQRCFPWLVRK